MSALKKVLLTGAKGFIGRHAIEPLLKRGYEIHALSSRPMPLNSPVIWHQADLRDPFATAVIVATIKPTHCLHFAWYTAHGKFWTAPENLEWLENSLRLLRELNHSECKRIVIAGTCAEYDWSKGLCDEASTPLNPATFYGVCKNALQATAAAYCKMKDISFAWGRVFLLYGPGESPQRLVPSVIRACLAGTAAACSHGRQIRDFLHVSDVADAFVALLDSPVEGAVNIGSGNPITLRELVEKIATQCAGPAANFGALPAPANDPPILLPRIDRLQNEVGWRPSIGLNDGLAMTIRSIQSELNRAP